MNTKQLIVLFLLLAIGAGVLLVYKMQQTPSSEEQNVEKDSPPSEKQNAPPKEKSELYQDIPEDERSQVRQWIDENNLNRYGDPEDTVYTGGTPLFDEEAGERISLYDYLRENYPEKPWLKEEETSQSDSQSDEKEVSQEEPIPFSKVEEWKQYTGPRYMVEYPADSDVINASVRTDNLQSGEEVRFTADGNFVLSIAESESSAAASDCTRKSRLRKVICHNESKTYQNIYQRMIDSMRPVRR